MRQLKALVLGFGLATVGATAQAADFSDPTWPCVQRKVTSLSLGLMWPHPITPDARAESAELRADITELAGYLSLRRVELESLQPRIDAFATAYEGDAETLGLVFATVFKTLSDRRGRIMTGIEDFSLSQIALSEQIDSARAEMNTLMEAEDPDFDRVDQLEEQLDWDQLIYTDRQRNIAYLCETPTLLERRLFSIAQTLSQAVRDDS